ncbi:hypothetical protein P8452_03501 [Trifolium repens]|nr:hypothetical protein P8452_03501 [Trifolium repens]
MISHGRADSRENYVFVLEEEALDSGTNIQTNEEVAIKLNLNSSYSPLVSNTLNTITRGQFTSEMRLLGAFVEDAVHNGFHVVAVK